MECTRESPKELQDYPQLPFPPPPPPPKKKKGCPFVHSLQRTQENIFDFNRRLLNTIKSMIFPLFPNVPHKAKRSCITYGTFYGN